MPAKLAGMGSARPSRGEHRGHMDIYKPLPTGMVTSPFRPTRRKQLLELLNWYDLVAGGVTLTIVSLIVLPIVHHYGPAYILWPLGYAAYVLSKSAPGPLARPRDFVRDHIIGFVVLLTRYLSSVGMLPKRRARLSEPSAQRLLHFSLGFALTIAALLFSIEVRRADSALGLPGESDGALWLLFVLPILRLARYGSLVWIVAMTSLASVCITVTHLLSDGRLTTTSARLILIQCAWLVLICLLPAVLARYLAETRSGLEAAVAVVGELARQPYVTEQDFLNRSAEIIKRRLGYTEVNILVPTLTEDHQRDGLRFAGAATKHGQDLVTENLVISFQDGVGVTVAAAQRKRPQVVNDVRKDRERRRLFLENAHFKQTQSEMAFPIMLGGKLMGVLDIESDETFAFSDDDAAIMQAIVTHLAIALEYPQNVARAQELYRMSRTVTQHIFLHRSVQQMLQALAAAARQELAASSVVIYAWDPIRQIFLEPVTDGPLKAPVASAATIAESQGRSLVHKVMFLDSHASGEMGATDEPARQLWLGGDDQRRAFAERAGIKTCVALPLRTGWASDSSSNALGALFINYERPRLFGTEQQRWCQTVGDLASLALQNVWLHEQAAEEERRDIWYEIHDGMVQDAWILRDAIARVAEACERTNHLIDEERDDLDRAVWCSVSLHRQVNYLVDLWSETRRREAARSTHQGHPAAPDSGFFHELHEFATIVRQAYEVVCTFEGSGDDATVPSDIRYASHMIVREAIRNATRHGRASHIHIKATVANDQLALTVTDDGAGFRPARVRVPRGLKSIQRRAQHCGGCASVVSTPGKGTDVKAVIPLAGTTLVSDMPLVERSALSILSRPIGARRQE